MITSPSSLTSDSLSHDLLNSLILLTCSMVGGLLAWQTMHLSGHESVHLRLLGILLVQPFAMATWVFCGLPGLGLAVKSLFAAMEQRKVVMGIFSTGLMALSLAGTLLWF